MGFGRRLHVGFRRFQRHIVGLEGGKLHQLMQFFLEPLPCARVREDQGANLRLESVAASLRVRA